VEREAAGGEFPSPIVSVEQVDDEETEVVSKREAGGGGGAQTLERSPSLSRQSYRGHPRRDIPSISWAA